MLLPSDFQYRLAHSNAELLFSPEKRLFSAFSRTKSEEDLIGSFP